jgi:uncharacterized membrane protein
MSKVLKNVEKQNEINETEKRCRHHQASNDIDSYNVYLARGSYRLNLILIIIILQWILVNIRYSIAIRK